MEQPTLFYATVIILGVTGAGDGANLTLAWVYVGLRIAHSIVQAVWNRVSVRFALFSAATVALLLLAFNAARVTFERPIGCTESTWVRRIHASTPTSRGRRRLLSPSFATCARWCTRPCPTSRRP